MWGLCYYASKWFKAKYPVKIGVYWKIWKFCRGPSDICWTAPIKGGISNDPLKHKITPVLLVINQYHVGIAWPNSNLTLPGPTHGGAAAAGNATAVSRLTAAARHEVGRTQPAVTWARTASEISSSGRFPKDPRQGRRPGWRQGYPWRLLRQLHWRRRTCGGGVGLRRWRARDRPPLR